MININFRIHTNAYIINLSNICSLALMACPLTKRPWLTGSLLITGVILFSGTCYYSSIYGDLRYNKLAPLGGTSLILAWLSMIFF